MAKTFVKYQICDEEKQTSKGVWEKTGKTKEEILESIDAELEVRAVGETCKNFNKYDTEIIGYFDGDTLLEKVGERLTLVDPHSEDCGYVGGNILNIITTDGEPYSLIYKINNDSDNILNSNQDYEVSQAFLKGELTNIINDISPYKGNSKIKIIKKLPTTKYLKYMNNFFSGCINLISIDMTEFFTNKVEDMSNLFYNCSSIETLDLSSWDVSNVESMSEMFMNCTNLNKLDLSGWNLSNLKNVKDMFKFCNNLEYLNVKNWKEGEEVDSVWYTDFNFSNLKGLKVLDLTGWDKNNKLGVNVSNCESLIEIKGLEDIDFSNRECVFKNCKSLEYLDLSNSHIHFIDGLSINNKKNIFQGCHNLRALDLSGTEMAFTSVGDSYYDDLSGCVNLLKIYAKGCNESMIEWLNEYKPFPITKIITDKTIKEDI